MTSSMSQSSYPPPPLHSKQLGALVPLHPRRTNPNDSTLTPPINMQRMCGMKQDMQTRRHMNHKMSREQPVGMHVQLM